MIYHKVRGVARSWVREIEFDILNGEDPSPCEKAYSMVYEAWQNGLPEHVVSTVSNNNGWITCIPKLFDKELHQQSLDILNACGLDHELSNLITGTWLEFTKSKVSKNIVVYTPDELKVFIKQALAEEAEHKRQLEEKARITNRALELAEKAGINLHNMYMSYQAASPLTYHKEKAAYDSYVETLIKSYDPKTDTLNI